jgi:hypothetical protein
MISYKICKTLKIKVCLPEEKRRMDRWTNVIKSQKHAEKINQPKRPCKKQGGRALPQPVVEVILAVFTA